jgi:hypothetical protein
VAHEFQQFQSVSWFIGRMSSRSPRLTLGIRADCEISSALKASVGLIASADVSWVD